jgi:glyoxalase family protein
MNPTGIHHLTAVSAQIRENKRFYTETLGMRLVKRSVNQDDVSAYHLFYADGQGSPGTDLTFFDWPVPRERRGTRSISRTFLRVAGLPALEWWSQHLREKGVTAGGIVERDGRLTLDFEDPEGQRLALVDDQGLGEAHPWERSPVPIAFQIRGLGPIMLSVPELGPTATVLQQVLNMRPVREYQHPEQAKDLVHVYEMGAGGVHHVALRTPDNEYDAWADRLRTLRVPNSGKVDRYWFRSLYFREPNGILFEIASDGPGFAVDEDAATLGEKIVLAPFLEPQRAAIVAGLKPLD